MSRACWHVFQAKNGDRWFGSDGQGVYRWDGKTLIHYTTEDGLSGNRIRGIQGDQAGNVYFTTFDGICRFDGRAFHTLPVVAGEGAGDGWRLHPEDLWFHWFTGMPSAPQAPDAAPIEGPYRFDGTTLYHLRLPKSDLDTGATNRRWSPYEVYDIYRDRRGHVWIGTGEFGVCRYDGRSFGWLYERHLTIAPNGGSFGIRSVIEDADGAFWICNTGFRFRVQPENRDGKIVYTREAGIDPQLSRGEEIYFQGAEADAKGELWLSPYGGGIWHCDGKSLTNYPVKDEGEDTHVFRIFKDNAGVMWLGTPTAGPYRFDGEAFEPFRP
ncbi:MAG: two-component regulator propeller domain-containing protein [Planctomycetota bacterium]